MSFEIQIRCLSENYCKFKGLSMYFFFYDGGIRTSFRAL